jgi:hypothetical protein
MNEKAGVYLRGTEHLAPEERQRARRATEICGQVAAEMGLTIEVLEGLTAWMEFVQGQMSELDLWEKTRSELERREAHYVA